MIDFFKTDCFADRYPPVQPLKLYHYMQLCQDTCPLLTCGVCPTSIVCIVELFAMHFCTLFGPGHVCKEGYDKQIVIVSDSKARSKWKFKG